MRGNLQWFTVSNDATIETAEPGDYAPVGMQEAHGAGHNHGDISSRFGGTKDSQSSLDAGSTLTHALQAMMTLSPTHGIAWIDADPIVPDM